MPKISNIQANLNMVENFIFRCEGHLSELLNDAKNTHCFVRGLKNDIVYLKKKLNTNEERNQTHE